MMNLNNQQSLPFLFCVVSDEGKDLFISAALRSSSWSVLNFGHSVFGKSGAKKPINKAKLEAYDNLSYQLGYLFFQDKRNEK